jgi:hypothetical protein
MLLILCPFSSFANINFEHIVQKVKGFIGEELTRAYCMVKRDCHQRVIYVVNPSEDSIMLNGCNFDVNQIVSAGGEAFTARKNSKGHACELTISKGGEILSVVNLSPRESQIDYQKQNRTYCLTGHRVLKSWKKCPWGCGHYEVHGYIGACAVG